MILFVLFSILFQAQEENIRIFEYQGQKVKTTYAVDEQFIGKYAGRKAGFLELKTDGTGYYKYDIFGFALKGCTAEPIKIEWGFILDEDGEPVKFEREYGYSYPILMRSISENSFKGCREVVMLDFIIDNGTELEVSSSDDWHKTR